MLVWYMIPREGEKGGGEEEWMDGWMDGWMFEVRTRLQRFGVVVVEIS
jgi:hypothetical protein